MPKHWCGADTYTCAWLVVLGLSLGLLGEAHAQGDDMPSTLPDDGPAPEPSSAPPLRFEATINAALSVPLARNPDVAGFGLAATYGVGWAEIPLAFGLSFVNVGSIDDASSQLDLTLKDMTQVGERLVNTRLMHFDVWLRVQPAHFPVRPYAEGFFGAQLFQAHWLLRAGNASSERAAADDWTHDFGWGVGVEFLGLLSSTGDTSLTLGMRRVYGGTAKVSRSVALAGERVPSRYEAGTSVLLLMLGIGLRYELGEPRPR